MSKKYQMMVQKDAQIFSYLTVRLNKPCMERIHQMSYSSLSDIGMLQIFSFLIK